MTVTCAYGDSDDDGGRWRCIPNTHRNKAMTSHHTTPDRRTNNRQSKGKGKGKGKNVGRVRRGVMVDTSMEWDGVKR